MLPELLFVLALAVGYVFIVNRSRLKPTICASIWCLPPLTILTTPWALVGGARSTIWYLWYHGFTANRALWSAGLSLSDITNWTFYWDFFALHIGWIESWTMLGIGLALSLAGVLGKPSHKGSRIIAYLGISGALYLIITATPNKSWIIGLPFYLLLWIFSWSVLTPFLAKWIARNRIAPWLLISILLVSIGFNVGGGFYVLQNWTDEGRRTWADNAQVVKQIATDMRAVLNNTDSFMWVPLYGSPASLQHYVTDHQGGYPQPVWIDLEESPDRFVSESVRPCKAVLVYEEDVDHVAQFMAVHQLKCPTGVRSPNSSRTRTARTAAS